MHRSDNWSSCLANPLGSSWPKSDFWEEVTFFWRIPLVWRLIVILLEVTFFNGNLPIVSSISCCLSTKELNLVNMHHKKKYVLKPRCYFAFGSSVFQGKSDFFLSWHPMHAKVHKRETCQRRKPITAGSKMVNARFYMSSSVILNRVTL